MQRKHVISIRDLQQVARGFLMGGADIIPGVSGGTVALILGIYGQLVTAISHFDLKFLNHLRKREWFAAATHIDLRFLATLGCGIGIGVILLAGWMHYLLEYQLQHTLAAFFGMIVVSSLLVGRMVVHWTPREVCSVVGGALFAFCLVGLPFLEKPPDTALYVLLSGMIAICAMILPGISGAFILLIMGKYKDITGILADIPRGDLTLHSLETLGLFGVGAAVGLISFSKFLNWLLAHHKTHTMAALCGFMIGSLRKIWPFKKDMMPEITDFQFKQFENTLPDLSQGRVWLSILIVGLAAAFVWALDRLTAQHRDLDLLKSSKPS
jgi:putative membrane protein